MELESLPANDNLKFMYGSFVTDYSYNKEKNEINAISKFELNNHVIPAAQYNEMQQFIEGVSKSAGKKMVLKKKG